mmetsp:Transcript_17878/g.26762  ORF Transcript_17878/g.26762 Transcript_17878/m.26762 type:complete len:458 (+) Transcript_17878:60-1433(+)
MSRRVSRSTRTTPTALLIRPDFDVRKIEYAHVYSRRKKGGFRKRTAPNISQNFRQFVVRKILSDKRSYLDKVRKDVFTPPSELRKPVVDKEQKASKLEAKTSEKNMESVVKESPSATDNVKDAEPPSKKPKLSAEKVKSDSKDKAKKDSTNTVHRNGEAKADTKEDSSAAKNADAKSADREEKVISKSPPPKPKIPEKSYEEELSELEEKLKHQQKQKHLLFIHLKRVLLEEQMSKQKQQEEESAREQAYIRARDSLLNKETVEPSTPTAASPSPTPSTPTSLVTPTSHQRAMFRPPFIAQGHSSLLGFPRDYKTTTPGIRPRIEEGQTPAIFPNSSMGTHRYPNQLEYPPPSPGKLDGGQSQGVMPRMPHSPVVPIRPMGMGGNVENRVMWRSSLLHPHAGLRPPSYSRQPPPYMRGRRAMLGRPAVLMPGARPPPHPAMILPGRGRGRGFPPFPH